MDKGCAKVQITNNAAAGGLAFKRVSVFVARKGALAYFWLTLGALLLI